MAERGPAVDTDAGWPGSATTSRRWMRDLDALLALPALWADHEPLEIATGLLSVLFSILELTGGYARFDDPDTGRALETWRPSGAEMPFELRFVLQTDLPEGPGMRTTEAPGNGRGPLRVTSVPVVLPWESGLVLVSAPRADFPTAMEAHLLGVAVGQAAIAIHTARRLARADSARATAEDTVRRQNELLRSLVDEVDPSLRS